MNAQTAMNKDEKAQAIQQIAEAVEKLSESPLYEYRVKNSYLSVVGDGDVDADIMFIGEAPGKQEAKQGKPFVGASGRVLDELLEMIELDRQAVYITNVVKDRPPENRDPSVEEINLYAPFLWQQIEIIEPKVIATLGRFAMEFVLNQFNLPLKVEKISDLHGKPIAAKWNGMEVTIIPLYHPAVALYNRNQRNTLEEDFRTIKRYI